MAVAESMKPVVEASLRALVDPPADGTSSAPRDILVRVSSSWADDASAWRLARRLVSEAELFMVELDRCAQEQPGDPEIRRLQSRARYAHLVGLTLYRELRVPGDRR